MRRAVERFNRPLLIEADGAATARTRERLDEQRAFVRAELEGVDLRIDLEACVQRREGELSLYTALERCLSAKHLTELDRRFCETMVSNPESGELINGHAIVLAELGLCRFKRTIVRDPELFDEPWSRSRRASHRPPRVYAGALGQRRWPAFDAVSRGRRRRSASSRPSDVVRLVPFSEQVADEHFTGGPTTRSAVKWRAVVDNRTFALAEVELCSEVGTVPQRSLDR